MRKKLKRGFVEASTGFSIIAGIVCLTLAFVDGVNPWWILAALACAPSVIVSVVFLGRLSD